MARIAQTPKLWRSYSLYRVDRKLVLSSFGIKSLAKNRSERKLEILRRGSRALDSSMAQEVAREILRELKLQDRPSQLYLSADGDRGSGCVFKVYAPIEGGAVVWQVDAALDRSVSETCMVKYSDKGDALSLIDGILGRSLRQFMQDLRLTLFSSEGNRKLGSWRLLQYTGQDGVSASEAAALRLRIVEDAMNTLRTK